MTPILPFLLATVIAPVGLALLLWIVTRLESSLSEPVANFSAETIGVAMPPGQ